MQHHGRLAGARRELSRRRAAIGVTARGGRFESKRRHESRNGRRATRDARKSRARDWPRHLAATSLRDVAIDCRGRRSRSYWTTRVSWRPPSRCALSISPRVGDIPFSIVYYFQGRARNAPRVIARAIYIRNIIYIIEGLFERVNCYLYSMSWNVISLRDDDNVSKSTASLMRLLPSIYEAAILR